MSICLGFAARQPHTDTRLQAHRDNRSKQALIMRKRFMKRRAQWDSRCPLGCAETLRAAEPPFAPPFAAHCAAVACAADELAADELHSELRKGARQAVRSPTSSTEERHLVARGDRHDEKHRRLPSRPSTKRLKGFSARALQIFLNGSFLAISGQRFHWVPIR